MEVLRSLQEIVRRTKTEPSLRRFFINTLFDSTFMLLGIVVGSAFTLHSNLKTILSTMIASSIALGISTGISVYEAESLEWRLKLEEMERAMLTNLENTGYAQIRKEAVILISMINFLTPLLSCAVTISPFLIAFVGLIRVEHAGYASTLLALSTLFFSGAYIGKKSKTNPWMKGLHMAVFGVIAFIAGLIIETIVKFL